MEIERQQAQQLFAKYRLNKFKNSEQKEHSIKETLDQIIEIGNIIFCAKEQNKLNLNLNQGFIQKSNTLLPNGKRSQKISRKVKCYSERHSQCEKSSVFNLKQDDWISQNNYFDQLPKNKNRVQFSFKKQFNPQVKTNFKKQKVSKISDHLLKPVRNFKKKILEEIQQKKIKQEQEFQSIQLQNKSNISLSQFYEHNKQHLPVYQKTEIIQSNKKKLIELRKVQINKKTMKGVTFKPKITNKAKQINKTFQERLIQSKNNKEINQQKIILEELKNSPFNPKTNKLSSTYMNAESRVKSIWTNGKTSSKCQTNSQISHSNIYYCKKTSKNEERMVHSFRIQQKDIPLFQQFMYQ